VPRGIYVDNGPEVVSRALDAWAPRHGVKLAFSRPGTPTDRPFIESFNGHFRQGCRNLPWFAALEEAYAVIEAGRVEYTTVRPHRALPNWTPAAYRAHWSQTQEVQAAGSERFGWTKNWEQVRAF
jgi:putative transposase